MFVNLEIRNDDVIWIIITPGNDTEEIALKHIMHNLGLKKRENTFKLNNKTIIKFGKAPKPDKLQYDPTKIAREKQAQAFNAYKGQFSKENTLFDNQLGQYPWLKKP